jgi:hypothetical protein
MLPINFPFFMIFHISSPKLSNAKKMLCTFFLMKENVKSNLNEERKKKHIESFIADAQTSSTAFVSSYYPSEIRSSATSLEEEVILSLLGLPSDMHKSSSGNKNL